MIFQNNHSLNFILNSIQADRDLFNQFINDPDQSKYFRITTRYKRDGERTIFEPQGDGLQNIYKNLYEKLVEYQKLLPPYVHGFVKGRSTYTNAKAHLAKKYILNLDITNFFEHITKESVEKTLLRLGAQQDVARAFSLFCTVNGVLPQGTHTSPDIANHCFHELDQLLDAYARKNNLVYTRYADDMTFSGDYRIRTSEVINIIEESQQYKVSARKTKLQKRGANQYVTGLTVFDDQQPRISKLYKKRLRLELYYLDKYGVESLVARSIELGTRPNPESPEYPAWVIRRDEIIKYRLDLIRGRINYINAVEPELARKMWPILDKVTD